MSVAPHAELLTLGFTSIDGEQVPLSRFAGDVLLVVNVASRCGFTEQYAALQQLFVDHRAAGLTILGFPCNQFAGQEAGSNQEVKSFCQTRFGVTFPLSEKVAVNGPDAHPVYRHLCRAVPGLWGSRRIKWNFTKFLVGRDGIARRRFGPRTPPARLLPDLLAELARR